MRIIPGSYDDTLSLAFFEGHANPIAHARLAYAAPDLLAALQAFAEQATKVSGFPAAYDPYVGALLVARAAISKATGG